MGPRGGPGSEGSEGSEEVVSPCRAGDVKNFVFLD